MFREFDIMKMQGGNTEDENMNEMNNEEPENVLISPANKNGLSLELGDIIQVIAPTNLELNERSFYIYYLDETKLKVIDLTSNIYEIIKINPETHAFQDESITEIYLLSRSDDPGYSRQNGLLPEQWVDIHFGGEIPSIITGRISNLEEDCIEITAFPSNDVLYIDFEYKGIPENIPILKIVKRDAPREYIYLSQDNGAPEPEQPAERKQDKGEEPVTEEESPPPSMEYSKTGELIFNTPEHLSPLEENPVELLHGMYLDANALFNAESHELYQLVEIPESEKKYGIDVQLNDLIEKLLSEIPNSQRTTQVLFQLHKFIRRYRELRQMFSYFDSNGNVTEKKKNGKRENGYMYKPLINRLSNLDQKMQWIIPVVKQSKYIYYQTANQKNTFESGDLPDVILLDEKTQINELKQQIERYDENLSIEPFAPTDEWKDIITYQREILTDIECIVSNFGSLSSHNCCSGIKTIPAQS